MNSHRIFRTTPQRQCILEELKKAACHPTADDIYDRVRRRLPHISLGTVYRNLEFMAAQGIIQRLDMGGAQRRYDINPDPHHHVRCLQCGSVGDAFVEEAVVIDDLPAVASEYEIQEVRLEFLGLCPHCREKRHAPS